MNAAARRRAARRRHKKRARDRAVLRRAEVILACAGRVPYNDQKLSLRLAKAINADPTITSLFAVPDVDRQQVELFNVWRRPAVSARASITIWDDIIKP